MSIIDHENNRRFFTSQVGLPSPWREKRQTPLKHSFCRHVVADNAVLVIEDATQDARDQDSLVIPDLGVVAYLGAPIHDAYGRPVGALCVIDNKPLSWTARDISTLKSLAACVTEAIKLKVAYLDKEALLSDQTEFNYSISHDLKSPVSTVQRLLDEMAKKWKSGEIQGPDDLLKKTLQTTQAMQVMIDDTLDYIQVSMSEDTASTTVPLETTLATVQEQLSDKISASKAIISISSLPALVADPNLLNTLFRQLISNAIKFRNPEVPPAISVSYESHHTDSFHKIVVSDNGIGIDAEYHDFIFTLFARLHTGDQYSGTGLGLSICRRIVSFYGGRLEIESTPGHGTRMIILLPTECSIRQAA